MATFGIREPHVHIASILLAKRPVTDNSRAAEVVRMAIHQGEGAQGLVRLSNAFFNQPHKLVRALLTQIPSGEAFGDPAEIHKRVEAEALDVAEGLLHAYAKRWVATAGMDMRHGIHDHFKGGVYLSTEVVRFVEDNEPLVNYVSMIFGTKHARRAAEWNEVVQWPDGMWRSRFVFRGETLQTMAPYFKVPSPSV